MAYTGKEKKKKNPLALIIVLLAAAAVAMPEEGFITVLAVCIGLAMIALPIWLVVKVLKQVSANAGTSAHTHDRIDHSSDLKINPRTGRVVHNPVSTASPHSQREHWKQQLDTLLANGTIDRAEYRQMLNRKFK